MQPLPAWEILHYLPSRQSNPQQKIRAHQPLQTYEQIPAKQHTHCSPRLDQLISLYSHVIPHERLILHVLLFIVLYWCDMYLCTSAVIQCLFQWIGRQVTCPHETDLSNKVLMYPENFWSSIVSYAPHQRVEHCLSGTWIQQFYIYICIYIYIYIQRITMCPHGYHHSGSMALYTYTCAHEQSGYMSLFYKFVS